MLDKKLLAIEVESLMQVDLAYDEKIEEKLLASLRNLMASIPAKRRASYGIVSVIAIFCKEGFKQKEDCYDLGMRIYQKSSDFRTVCIGLGLLSHIGIKRPQRILPILKEAADHELWEVKEFVQMFIRKITKENKIVVQNFLLDLSKSSNPSLRRFSSEALRPVVENKWIHDQPEYSLKVLRNLFEESEEFPKVSVANNLSDLSRKNPDLILEIVKELKSLNNINSDFIAFRACRNLIKSHSLEVLNILEMDSYKYKNKLYKRSDYTMQ